MFYTKVWLLSDMLLTPSAHAGSTGYSPLSTAAIAAPSPLDTVYPILYLDCIHVKVRDSGTVGTKAVYLALGVNMSGLKELLGMWISPNEGAKFWLSVVTALRNRGVQNIFIACVDGLKGFPEAIESVFPKTQIQLCIVHMVRNSLKYVGWKERKAVAADLKEIYSAPTAELAYSALEGLERKHNSRYPLIAKSWRANWERVIPFFGYPPEIRKVIYTTNAIESLNMSLRKVTKAKGAFPHDEAVFKIFWLALRSISQNMKLKLVYLRGNYGQDKDKEYARKFSELYKSMSDFDPPAPIPNFAIRFPPKPILPYKD